MTQFPSTFPNALAEPSQNNLHQIPQQNYGQTLQTKPLGPLNQPSTFALGNYQPQLQTNRIGPADYGTAGIIHNPQPYSYQYPTINPNPAQLPCNNNWYGQQHGMTGQYMQPTTLPPINVPTNNVTTGCGPLPQNIIDQMRAYPSVSSPIFILPNGATNNNPYPVCQPPPMCPIASSYIPYHMPVPFYHHNLGPNKSRESESSCKCPSTEEKNWLAEACEKLDRENSLRIENNYDSLMKHRCYSNIIGVVCSKKNCPASIQLQAMVSQLLGIQGIVPSAITRILLKQVPGSNITDSIDDIMDRATRCIKQLSKDQLLKESKSCQEVNGLLGLYLTSSSTLARIIPILTNAQLKCNILKALVENLVNARIMENQGYGAEAPDPLDPLLIELKSDNELRQLLITLREKECEERVNLNFAACSSQRLIAESRLSNVQRKIDQIEKEINKRRNRDSELCKRYAETSLSKIKHDLLNHAVSIYSLEQNFLSPNPFADIFVRNPKKLLLKPHVGSPETTYQKPNNKNDNVCKPQVKNNLNNPSEQPCTGETTGQSNSGCSNVNNKQSNKEKVEKLESQNVKVDNKDRSKESKKEEKYINLNNNEIKATSEIEILAKLS